MYSGDRFDRKLCDASSDGGCHCQPGFRDLGIHHVEKRFYTGSSSFGIGARADGGIELPSIIADLRWRICDLLWFTDFEDLDRLDYPFPRGTKCEAYVEEVAVHEKKKSTMIGRKGGEGEGCHGQVVHLY